MKQSAKWSGRSKHYQLWTMVIPYFQESHADRKPVVCRSTKVALEQEPLTSTCFLWRVTSRSTRALPGGLAFSVHISFLGPGNIQRHKHFAVKARAKTTDQSLISSLTLITKMICPSASAIITRAPTAVWESGFAAFDPRSGIHSVGI
eukprot:6202049-Pleurochrysis_carterae.AAC.3